MFQRRNIVVPLDAWGRSPHAVSAGKVAHPLRWWATVVQTGYYPGLSPVPRSTLTAGHLFAPDIESDRKR